MNFDIGGAHVRCGLNLRVVRINKQRNQDTGVGKTFTGIAHFVELARHVQTAFGGHFLAFFRYQAAEMGLSLTGDIQHLFRHRHLKVHAGIQRLAQNTDIAIGNMATILAQMDGNTVSAGLLGDKSRLYRIRISGTAGVA